MSGLKFKKFQSITFERGCKCLELPSIAAASFLENSSRVIAIEILSKIYCPSARLNGELQHSNQVISVLLKQLLTNY